MPGSNRLPSPLHSVHGDLPKSQQPTTRGFVPLDLDDAERSKVSDLEHAVRHYRETGDASRIGEIPDTTFVRIEGGRRVVHQLETDPAELEVLFGSVVGDYEFYLDD